MLIITTMIYDTVMSLRALNFVFYIVCVEWKNHKINHFSVEGGIYLNLIDTPVSDAFSH